MCGENGLEGQVGIDQQVRSAVQATVSNVDTKPGDSVEQCNVEN